MTETQPGQTQIKYVKIKRKTQTTRNNRIQIPDIMTLWELPLEYIPMWVERENEIITLRLKIVKEGGKEPSERHEVVINE